MPINLCSFLASNCSTYSFIFCLLNVTEKIGNVLCAHAGMVFLRASEASLIPSYLSYRLFKQNALSAVVVLVWLCPTSTPSGSRIVLPNKSILSGSTIFNEFKVSAPILLSTVKICLCQATQCNASIAMWVLDYLSSLWTWSLITNLTNSHKNRSTSIDAQCIILEKQWSSFWMQQKLAPRLNNIFLKGVCNWICDGGPQHFYFSKQMCTLQSRVYRWSAC